MFNQNFLLLNCRNKKKENKNPARNEIRAQLPLDFQVTVRVKNLSMTPCISFCQAAATLCQAPEAQGTGRCPGSAALGERAPVLTVLLPCTRNRGNVTRRWCLIYSWQPSTAEVFCFHRISVAIMLGWDCHLF